jgi:integrase
VRAKKSKWVSVGEWEGGYKRQKVDAETGKPLGKSVFVIEKCIKSDRFHVSTRATDRQAALKHLARFEVDPKGYTPASVVPTTAPRLTTALSLEYHAHQLAQGVTAEWADEMARCLADWIEVVGDKDLRALSLANDLHPALEQWPRRKSQRIKAIKGLFTWLRTVKHTIKNAEDATLDLLVPQAKPEKDRRRKVIDVEIVRRVYRELNWPLNDVLLLLSATAWHVSEARRFVVAGEIVRPPPGRIDGPLAVLVTEHKTGGETRTPLKELVYIECAERLLAIRGDPKRKGALPNRMGFARAMRAACDAAGVTRFGMGVMRHSVLTWGHDLGADFKALAEFAGHKSESTTRRFYVDSKIPTRSIPTVRVDADETPTPASAPLSLAAQRAALEVELAALELKRAQLAAQVIQLDERAPQEAPAVAAGLRLVKGG